MKRICPKCGKAGKFHKTASVCKSCVKIKNARWLAENRDYSNVIRRIWYYKKRLGTIPEQQQPVVQELIQQLEQIRDATRISKIQARIDQLKGGPT